MPALKGTEVSLSYVQCFLDLVSSSINVSIFHTTWPDTFWTDHNNIYVYKNVCVDRSPSPKLASHFMGKY